MKTWVRYRNLPVKDKLRLIIMSTVGAALIVACGAVLAYEHVQFREDMRNDLTVLAKILGSNSTAALTFGDQRAGVELLSSLKAKEHIVEAVIYSADERPFAIYRRDSRPHAPALPEFRPYGNSFQHGEFSLFQNIQLNGQTAGTVYLESDLG